MNKTSFGKYFDDQRDRIVSDMQHKKNAELYCSWREDYDKRLRKRQEKKRTDEKYKKELEECSEKGVEISEECKSHFKKQYETTTSEKNDERKENSKRSKRKW